MFLQTIQIAKAAIARRLSHRLNRNVGWLTGAELVSRVGRIFTAVILARQLDAVTFGIAAIALTVFELVRVFTENGIGSAVIRASDEEFDAVANTAHRLMWRVCLGLAAAQVAIGLIFELIYPGRGVGIMIASLGGVFLLMPFGVVHAYCLQRAERIKHLATVASGQSLADHFLTAALALSGAGAWAIILPKLLTAPIWLFGVRYTLPWKRNRSAGFASVRAILVFSMPVLGAELLTAVRDQLDKFIISATLGLEALGLYYFAFNAGLGVSTALNRAFSNAVYPNLCAAKDVAATYKRAMLNLGLPICGAYLAQATAALLYVPIVFGPNWASAAPLVAILCLGGPARLIVDGARMKARAEGNSKDEFWISLTFAGFVLVPFTVASAFGLTAAVIGSVVGATIYAGFVTFILVGAVRPAPVTKLGALS